MKKPTVQEATIVICGEPCKVMAYQVSKTVWTAHGKYKGRDCDAKGRTASQAFDRWKSRVQADEFN
jgi:hypothetical protein